VEPVIRGLWRRSFPEVVSDGNRCWNSREFLAAAIWYWRAAYVAPTEADETRMLEWAWQATERAQGRRSELEASR